MDAEGVAESEPQNQDPEIIGTSVSMFFGFLEQYGWFLVIGIAVALYLYFKLQGKIQQWRSQREANSYKKIDAGVVQDRMEAMERARMRMQQQLDQQAQEFAEKQQKREEEKRQERIRDWDLHQQGKGYRNKTKAADNEGQSKSSTSSPSKPTQPKKRLRPEYSPLMGDSDSYSRFRPAPRGGASGGG